MKGYKITNADMTCRNYQYELNKEFILNGRLKLCKNGFHFCQEIIDCFDYYTFYNGERLFEIETLGEIITEDDKSVTDKIIFLRELTKEEIYIIFSYPRFDNIGINNIGYHNKGNYNKGYYNKGNNNIGRFNTGNNNIGDGNKGDNNIGHYNTGNNNIGDNNKGNCNEGSYNVCSNNIGNNNINK